MAEVMLISVMEKIPKEVGFALTDWLLYLKMMVAKLNRKKLSVKINELFELLDQ